MAHTLHGALWHAHCLGSLGIPIAWDPLACFLYGPSLFRGMGANGMVLACGSLAR